MVEQPGVDGESDTVRAAWKLRASAFRDMIIYYRNNPSILIWEGGNQKVTREHAAELRGFMDKYDPHGGRAYAHRRSDADRRRIHGCLHRHRRRLGIEKPAAWLKANMIVKNRRAAFGMIFRRRISVTRKQRGDRIMF